jgi:hypothetical protein
MGEPQATLSSQLSQCYLRFSLGNRGKIDISAHCRGQIVIGSVQSVTRGHAQALSIGSGHPKNIGAPIVICDAPGDEKPIRQDG